MTYRFSSSAAVAPVDETKASSSPSAAASDASPPSAPIAPKNAWDIAVDGKHSTIDNSRDDDTADQESYSTQLVPPPSRVSQAAAPPPSPSSKTRTPTPRLLMPEHSNDGLDLKHEQRVSVDKTILTPAKPPAPIADAKVDPTASKRLADFKRAADFFNDSYLRDEILQAFCFLDADVKSHATTRQIDFIRGLNTLLNNKVFRQAILNTAKTLENPAKYHSQLLEDLKALARPSVIKTSAWLQFADRANLSMERDRLVRHQQQSDVNYTGFFAALNALFSDERILDNLEWININALAGIAVIGIGEFDQIPLDDHNYGIPLEGIERLFKHQQSNLGYLLLEHLHKKHCSPRLMTEEAIAARELEYSVSFLFYVEVLEGLKYNDKIKDADFHEKCQFQLRERVLKNFSCSNYQTGVPMAVAKVASSIDNFKEADDESTCARCTIS
jgi:hypothetical protein